MYSRIYFHLLLSALVFCWLSSCEENDVLYGESIDDYTLTNTAKDDDALAYFARKELACIDAKADFQKAIPKGYQDVDLILRDPDGSLSQVKTTGTLANLYHNYESTDGGWMYVNMVTTTGYQKAFQLRGCNERNTYFYVAVYSPDGLTLEDVAAYSVSSRDLPLAYEMAFSSHDAHANDLSEHTVAGIAIRRGENRTTNLRAALGDTGHLAYLLRRYGHFSTPASYYTSDPKYAIYKGAVTGFTEGFNINGYRVNIAVINGLADGTTFQLFNYDVNQSSTSLIHFGDRGKRFSDRLVKIVVTRRGRLQYTYYLYATVNLPNNPSVIELEMM